MATSIKMPIAHFNNNKVDIFFNFFLFIFNYKPSRFFYEHASAAAECTATAQADEMKFVTDAQIFSV